MTLLIYQSNFNYLNHGDPIPNAITSMSLAVKQSFNLDDYYADHACRFPEGMLCDKNDRAVSVFGPGSPLTAYPIFKLGLALGANGGPASVMWHGKLAGSITVALAAAFLFLGLCLRCSQREAALYALLFALGTGAFSTSSQALWQHGPAAMYLALGIYFWSRTLSYGPSVANTVGTALSFALALVTRPTLGIIFFVFFFEQWLRDKKGVIYYLLAASPVLAGFALYNWRFWGSPFVTGQSLVGPFIALDKTGSPQMWVAPWEGALGLLFSPSRGILVYSPFLLFSLLAMTRVLRAPQSLDPIQRRWVTVCSVCSALLFGVAACWFDWWGGWAWGPRTLLEASIFLVLLLPFALQSERATGRELTSRSRRIRNVVFATCAIWAILVQALGAYTSDHIGWNNDPVNVDHHRERLWSLTDTQIGHQIKSLKIRRPPHSLSEIFSRHEDLARPDNHAHR